MNSETLQSIIEHPEVTQLIQLALAEDGVSNDLTTKCCQLEGSSVQASIVAKKPTIACGYPVIKKILLLANLETQIKVSTLAQEGEHLKSQAPFLILEGNMAALLSIERTILNFLIRMCGIAQYTRAVVDQVSNTHCKILHTRKTAPGHRRTDIYATLIGGAHLHRRSLDDAVLVKENHLRATPNFQVLIDGINKYRSQARFVEVEVTNFTELKHALMAKPDRVLLDNFSIENVKRAVDLFGSSVELEASGSITLENISLFAATNVDYVSLGALTHSAPAADLSLLFAQ